MALPHCPIALRGWAVLTRGCLNPVRVEPFSSTAHALGVIVYPRRMGIQPILVNVYPVEVDVYPAEVDAYPLGVGDYPSGVDVLPKRNNVYRKMVGF